MNLQLSVALGDYDHLRDLMSGVVRAPGIDITAMHPPVEEMFFRFNQFKEWDVCEMSFAKSISIMSQPDPWLALIPPSWAAFSCCRPHVLKKTRITPCAVCRFNS